MDPLLALNSIETVLRLAVDKALGITWYESPHAPDLEKLKRKQEEEVKRRDGVAGVPQWIEFLEFYELTKLILKEWESFQPVFGDKKRTEVYLSVVEDVRNAIAHNRTLVPHERDLLAGIAGHFRNQVAIYRVTGDPSNAYYPLIESVLDSFGRSHTEPNWVRLEVGQTVTFDCAAFHARGGTIEWSLCGGSWEPLGWYTKVAEGDRVQLEWTPTESDVGEQLRVEISIRSHERWTRHGPENYDDVRVFRYAVNPPLH